MGREKVRGSEERGEEEGVREKWRVISRKNRRKRVRRK